MALSRKLLIGTWALALAGCSQGQSADSSSSTSELSLNSENSAEENSLETAVRMQDWVLVNEHISEMGYRLDLKDWQGFANLFADGGRMVLPWGETIVKEDLAAATSVHLGQYAITHHMLSNIIVSIDDQTATAKSYLQATHDVSAQGGGAEWVVLGGYEYELVRQEDGWKFTEVRLNIAWERGEALFLEED